MPTVQAQAKRAFDSIALRKPERLWVHYYFALIVVLCLMVMTYVLNRVVVDRGLMAAEGVKHSTAQVLIAQDIVQESYRLMGETSPNFSRFEKSITQFENLHSVLMSSWLRSADLNDHFLRGDAPLYQTVREFVTLAKRFATGPPEVREDLQARLQLLYGAGRLHDDLLETTTLIVNLGEAEAAYFTVVQRAMLAASALVLLAEAIFIFLPAQRSVKSSIRDLQRNTSELRRSQTKLKQMNIQLEHMVKHDQLTGLPNRAYLTETLAEAVANSRASDWSLLLVGLDDFKSVNDMIGHHTGDALLVAVSRGLQNCVDHENIVAHVGGDEFVLVSGEPIRFLLERIMALFEDPFDIGGRRIPVNASIGHLEIGDDVREPMDILADAEIALQVAKNQGGNKAQAFTQDLRDDLGMMQKLQLDLRDAIENGEIEPWFQPQVRLSDGRLHGAEVLARWRHPTRGLLTPDVFLPAAERAGLMVDLDHAIWKSAMDQAWQWQLSEVWRPSISLNAAPDTIADPHLVERFLLSLQRSGLAADQVIVEVLETTLINGKDDIAAINIDSLADCGIALELDDFGTGYASLSKLTQLPLAGIKLDRSLITPLPDQAADSVIRAILALATELGLHVVAEGVEESAQAAHLNDRGCCVGQGYGFGKPMPAHEFTSWLVANATTKLKAGPDMARFA